jgi:hypothetical protein
MVLSCYGPEHCDCDFVIGGRAKKWVMTHGSWLMLAYGDGGLCLEPLGHQAMSPEP